MGEQFDFSRMHITPKDYLFKAEIKEGTDLLYLKPQGHKNDNEMSDVVYHANWPIPYHVHNHGYETFCVDAGSVEVIICGKRCIIHEGDMLHITPHSPHGFKMLSEGTIWRELFMGMNMSESIMKKSLLENSRPDLLEDQEFMAAYRLRHGTSRLTEVAAGAADIIPKHDVPQARAKGSALKRFQFDSVTCNLKVGRWEFGGEKELWEFVFAEPYSINWETPHPDLDLFVVLDGRVKVEANGHEFIAKKRDIINIPPYTPHRLTVLDKGTVLQANNVKVHLLDMLEEFQASAGLELGVQFERRS
jgi:quercetin dioxygenase-like cupin family protein